MPEFVSKVPSEPSPFSQSTAEKVPLMYTSAAPSDAVFEEKSHPVHDTTEDEDINMAPPYCKRP